MSMCSTVMITCLLVDVRRQKELFLHLIPRPFRGKWGSNSTWRRWALIFTSRRGENRQIVRHHEIRLYPAAAAARSGNFRPRPLALGPDGDSERQTFVKS